VSKEIPLKKLSGFLGGKMRLEDILEDYIKMVEIYEKTPTVPCGEVIEGGVYWLPADEPLFVSVINKEGNFVEVAPLSFCWPLATRHDLIIELSHPFSDIWIVQTDLITSVPERLLREAELIGKLKEEDLEILKKTLRGEATLPRERRGRGYNDHIHKKFKDFEYKRYKFLVEELLSSIDEAEKSAKSTAEEVNIPKFIRNLLEETAALEAVAASDRNVIEGEGAVAVFTPETVEIVIDESLRGKEGKVKIETPEGEIPIFWGVLPEVLTVKGISRKAFGALSRLKVEVKE
jgi:hypothetical protein